jgi:hydrogenase maturation protease
VTASTGAAGRTLVAGIGNVFLSDDAFGVEVANHLSGVALPEGVRVEDFGIRGLHLAYELLEGYDVLILADAVPMGEPPGTLAVIEPGFPPGPHTDGPEGPGGSDLPVVDAHTMSPDVVLAALARLGGSIERVLIVGCQPAVLQEGIGLSDPVAAAVACGADLCLELVTENRHLVAPRRHLAERSAHR